MRHDEIVERGERRRAAETAMLLVQAAAARAEVGSFARQGLEAPHRAARRYAMTGAREGVLRHRA